MTYRCHHKIQTLCTTSSFCLIVIFVYNYRLKYKYKYSYTAKAILHCIHYITITNCNISIVNIISIVLFSFPEMLIIRYLCVPISVYVYYTHLQAIYIVLWYSINFYRYIWDSEGFIENCQHDSYLGVAEHWRIRTPKSGFLLGASWCNPYFSTLVFLVKNMHLARHGLISEVGPLKPRFSKTGVHQGTISLAEQVPVPGKCSST